MGAAVDAALAVVAGPSSPLPCKGQGVEALSFLLRATAVKRRFAETPGAYAALVALAKADPAQYGVAVGSAVAQLATTVREQRQLALRELEVGVDEWEKLQQVAKERIEDSDSREEADARCEALVRAGVAHTLSGAVRRAEGRPDAPTMRRVVAEVCALPRPGTPTARGPHTRPVAAQPGPLCPGAGQDAAGGSAAVRGGPRHRARDTRHGVADHVRAHAGGQSGCCGSLSAVGLH